jgi:hypothetical protein
MKSAFELAIAALLFGASALFVPPALFAQDKEQKPRVAVFLPENTEKDDRYDGLCATIEDTIALNLTLIGKHEILTPERNAPNKEDQLLDYMEEHSIDNAVYGELFVDEKRNIVIELSVYGRSEQNVTTTKRVSAATYLDIFDATDELVTALLGTFSDRHIAYGSLRVRNEGVDGNYRVLLNGEVIGESVKNISRLLTGEYRLQIEQTRIQGETTLTEKKFTVKKNETTEVAFSIPALTEKEQALFRKIDTSVMRWWDHNREKTRRILRDAAEMTEAGKKASPEVARLHRKYSGLLSSYGDGPESAVSEDWGFSYKDNVNVYGKKYLALLEPSIRTDEKMMYPVEQVVGALKRDEIETMPGQEKVRFESQAAGGTLGVGGVNIALFNKHLQLSLLAGAGYGEKVVTASVGRMKWAMFNNAFTPTLSISGTVVSDFSKVAVNAGPSLGLSFRFNEGESAFYIENYFALSFVPFVDEYVTYLPAVGLIL